MQTYTSTHRKTLMCLYTHRHTSAHGHIHGLRTRTRSDTHKHVSVRTNTHIHMATHRYRQPRLDTLTCKQTDADTTQLETRTFAHAGACSHKEIFISSISCRPPRPHPSAMETLLGHFFTSVHWSESRQSTACLLASISGVAGLGKSSGFAVRRTWVRISTSWLGDIGQVTVFHGA